MGFYDKGYQSNAEMIKLTGGLGKTGKSIGDGLIKLGEQKQNKADKQAKFNLEENKKIEDLRSRDAKISGFRKLHPKTTKGLSDDEVYQVGNEISKIHNDKVNGKFVDSFTAKDGNRVMVTYNGNDKDGKPIYKNVIVGKAKDFKSGKGRPSSSKAKDFGYGYNEDGTSKTAIQYGEEIVSKKLKKQNKSVGMINLGSKKNLPNVKKAQNKTVVKKAKEPKNEKVYQDNATKLLTKSRLRAKVPKSKHQIEQDNLVKQMRFR